MSVEVNSEMFGDYVGLVPEPYEPYEPFNESMMHLRMWNESLHNITGGKNISWMIYLQSVCGEPADHVEVDELRYWALGVVGSLAALLGILGNAISLVILCSRSMTSMFNRLLACLCCADIMFLLTNLLLAPAYLMLADIYDGLYGQIFPWIECCSHYSLTLSIFLIICITIERYQAVCYPHYYQIRAQSGKHVLLRTHVLPSIIMAFIVNMLRFIQHINLAFDIDMQSHSAYLKLIIFSQIFHPFSTTGIIPLVLLSCLNYKVYTHMSETRYFHSTRRRTRDFLLAKVMSILVVVFLALNVPRLGISFFEVISIKSMMICLENKVQYEVSQDIYKADIIARLCAVLNSAINFMIYCMFGSEFRRQLFLLLGKNTLARNLSISVSRDPENSRTHHGGTPNNNNIRNGISPVRKNSNIGDDMDIDGIKSDLRPQDDVTTTTTLLTPNGIELTSSVHMNSTSTVMETHL